MNLLGKRAGYVSVAVDNGTSGLELVRRLNEEGIELFSVVYQKERIVFDIARKDLLLLRERAASLHCHLHVLSFGGLCFFPKKMKRFYAFFAFFAFFLLMMTIFSSFVWKLEIVSADGEALQEATVAEIEAAAEAEGLFLPLRKSSVKNGAYGDKILARCPDLAWLETECDGIKLLLRAAERSTAKIENDGVADIVAAKDGMIREIFVLRGQALCDVGDTVKKGDVLIDGHIVYEEEGKEPVYAETEAKGIITASVWYRGTAYVSLRQITAKPTGRVEGKIYVEKGDRRIVLFDSGEKSFANAVSEEKTLSFRGWQLTSLTYREAVAGEKLLTEKEALAAAEKKAGTLAQRKIPVTAKIVGRHRCLEKDIEGAVGVTVLLETEESESFIEMK